MPAGVLDEYVISQFDIRTVNSSANLGRESYQARLTEVGYRPQRRQRPTDPVVMTGPMGQITLSLFERGDHNMDGIEDVLVCLMDRPMTDPMTQQLLVLQKFSETTPLVALAVGINDPRCPPIP